MGLFNRRKKKQNNTQEVVPGIPDHIVASHDFDVVVRQLIAQMKPADVEMVEAGDDSIQVGQMRHYLGNLRKGWETKEPHEREIWLRNAIHGFYLSQLNDKSTLDLSMLRPGIRSQWYLEAGNLRAKATNPDQISNGPTSRPLGPGLVRVLIWDTPTTMSLITQVQIDEWGSDFETLWSAAVTNLAADPYEGGWAMSKVGPKQPSQGQIEGQFYSPVHADDYTAERLFTDDYLPRGSFLGEMVMFHPSRASLFLAEPDDEIGIAVAAQMAMNATSDANPVTFVPYIGRGESWRELELPADHMAYDVVQRLRVTEHIETHGQQKAMLEHIYGESMYIGAYMAYERDGQIRTSTPWTEGAASLLPRVDMISFVADPSGAAGEPDIVQVGWQAAREIVGHRMAPTEYWPERWYVETFPSPEEFEQLRAAQP